MRTDTGYFANQRPAFGGTPDSLTWPRVILPFLSALLLAPLTSLPVAAQSTHRLSPQVGFWSASELSKSNFGDETIDIAQGTDFTREIDGDIFLAVRYAYARLPLGFAVTLEYSNPDTEVRGFNGGISVDNDISTDLWFLEVGVNHYFAAQTRKAVPFIEAGIGVTRIEQGSESDDAYSLFFLGGIDYFLSPRVGIQFTGKTRWINEINDSILNASPILFQGTVGFVFVY